VECDCGCDCDCDCDCDCEESIKFRSLIFMLGAVFWAIEVEIEDNEAFTEDNVREEKFLVLGSDWDDWVELESLRFPREE